MHYNIVIIIRETTKLHSIPDIAEQNLKNKVTAISCCTRCFYMVLIKMSVSSI